MSHEDEPIFSLTDCLLALALVVCVLALLIHKLLAAPAATYAATAPPPPPRVYTEDAAMIMKYEHAALAAGYKEREYLAWRAQVVLDAKLKAAKIAAQKAAAAQVAVNTATGISTLGFSAFKACVAMRESTDGRASTNIYGILGGLWPGVPSDPWYQIALPYSSAWSAPASVQSRVFDLIYAQQGTAPWGPYDGC